MSLKKFIEDRETPYSKIQNIVDNEDGTVSYTEQYDLRHPMCPLIRVGMQYDKINSVSLVHKNSKEFFEILYGSLDNDKEIKPTSS